jgi:AraC family transcriptional regulator of adaptative response/methylated-DNA-[protein]-cysteine methyltransferase
MMKTLPTTKEMEYAHLTRDASFDGLFYVCVKTTGIFCRPSCPARKARPANIAYHATVRDCLLDGFRPCKRCRPLAIDGSAPPWLDVLLDRVEQSPCDRITDTDLRGDGIDPHGVRRYFKRNFDMTFQAYHRSRRMGLALEQLSGGGDQLSVGLNCGYDSHSGFRDAFAKTFGTTPGKREAIVCIKTMRLDTPIGPMVAAATDEGLCMLEFADRRALKKQVDTLKRRLRGTIVPGTNRHLAKLRTELAEYFDGRRRAFTVPLITPGTVFQEKVWSALRAIPFGQIRSYDDMARAIGEPNARRAVGRANGNNRIAILVPCHRVVRADGTLCGYGGGLWRKQHLLDLEKSMQPVADPRVLTA